MSDEHQRAVVCIRVIDAPDPGIVEATIEMCGACGAEVWHSHDVPIEWPILCVPCAAKLPKSPEREIVMTDNQRARFLEMGWTEEQIDRLLLIAQLQYDT